MPTEDPRPVSDDLIDSAVSVLMWRYETDARSATRMLMDWSRVTRLGVGPLATALLVDAVRGVPLD